jgi:DNA-binding response OmpR family regulator
MCVYLPAATLQTETATAPTVPVVRGAGETILLVEDECDVRRVVASALRRFGYHVVECASGESALAELSGRRGPIDLLVTDVVMAGLSGLDLAARVRARQPGVRILFISGHPASAVGIDASLDEDSAFLQKPFGPESIAAAVQALLHRTRSKGRILLADDDAAVRGFLRRVLASSGYEVTEVADGKQATTAICQQPFDLVITDLVMPEQEGLETIAQIRKQFPSMRIIAMSGAFGGRFLQVGERLGANATLTKPVHPQELIATVERVIAAGAPGGLAG